MMCAAVADFFLKQGNDRRRRRNDLPRLVKTHAGDLAAVIAMKGGGRPQSVRWPQ